jgi:hypothetical protein
VTGDKTGKAGTSNVTVTVLLVLVLVLVLEMNNAVPGEFNSCEFAELASKRPGIFAPFGGSIFFV